VVVREALAGAGLDRQSADVSGVESSSSNRKAQIVGRHPYLSTPRLGPGGTHGPSGHEGKLVAIKWDELLRNF
jgi:hypothetical protein